MDGVKRWRWWAVFILGALIGSQFACGGGNDSTKANHEALVSRIAFGSCANQTAPQPIWDAIIKFDPQVFIWMGDNIYGDIKRPSKMFGKERTIGPWKNVPRFVPTSQDEMNFKYHIIKNHPAYSRLRHNLNTKAGIYTSYTFGPVGRQIKIILLDTRYHRDPLSSDGTILGSTQWTWLEKELNGPSSAITIIVSSIQVISNLSATTGPLFYMESWGRFPKERDRLFQLIADSKRNGVFFISGDVHFGEITRYDCDVGYALYDITSSGLTQAVEKAVPAPFHFVVRFLAWWTPSTMRVIGKNCRHRSCTYGQPNFGAIEIDWDATPVALKIEVRDTDGIPAIGVNISLSELQAQSVNSAATLRVGEHQKHCSLEVDLPWIVRYRLTILFYFSVAVLLFALVGLNFAAAVVFRLFLRKCKLD
ncbi:hypothetical protein CISIN_1g013940mg [Citrus sinensis]|uniref:PhoD-like phosphatase metallophosphatase domain-containing protein n=1 Tax=Citrus sinensis TaxID=2711 RepID=A0A067H006_CITSI|nr:hypothetical protein CISIN_1g013940mg [Citrus sinensis]